MGNENDPATLELRLLLSSKAMSDICGQMFADLNEADRTAANVHRFELVARISANLIDLQQNLERAVRST